MNLKKTISFFIAAAMVSSVFTSCSNNSQSLPDQNLISESGASGDVSEIQNDTNVSESNLFIPSLPTDQEIEIKDLGDGIIASIGGFDITEDEFRYYFNYAKKFIDDGDDSYWDEEQTEKLNDLKEQTLLFIFNNYTVSKIAEEKSVKIDESESAAAEKQYQQDVMYYNAMNSADSKTFDDYLKESFCTEEIYKQSYIRNLTERKLMDSLYGNEFRDKYFGNCICIKYIQLNDSNYEAGKNYFEFVEGMEYTEEETDTVNRLNSFAMEDDQESFDYVLYELSSLIVSRLYDGESFDSLMKKYSTAEPAPLKEDGSSAGYYLDPSDMPQEFADEALSLEEHEYTTDPIYADDFGYFLVERETFDEEYLSDYHFSLYMDEEKYPYAEQYNKLYSDTQKKMKVILDDDFSNITLTSLFE